jgi:hypothetical protein
MSLDHIPPVIKTGNEPLSVNGENIGFTLLDYWKWSASDILSNATRGILAEFLVATATKIDIKNVRNEWDAFDLITPSGIKLEIKSAAYLQSWHQKIFSKISFSIKLARHWDSLTNVLAAEAKRHADVYVFCLLKHEVKQTVNPLNLDHWDFYVLSTHELNNYTRSQHSITINSLQKLTPAISYYEINDAVIKSHNLNQQIKS